MSSSSRRAVDHAFGLRQPDRHHLAGIVPLVDRRGDVQPLVALQPDQLAAERGGEHLGDLRLADPRLSFQQDGPTHPEGEEHDGRQRAVGRHNCLTRAASACRRWSGKCSGHGAGARKAGTAERTARAGSGATTDINNKAAGTSPAVARCMAPARDWRLEDLHAGRSDPAEARRPPDYLPLALLADGRRHRPLRHDADQMGAIFRAGVDVAVEARRRQRHAVERLRREALLQGFLEALARNTPFAPAPVTATRTSEPRLATKTPTSA